MEVKKKYCLIAFCAIILLAFICAPLGIRSRKVNDKDIERMYELYNQLVDERPDTFALVYAVAVSHPFAMYALAILSI